MQDKYVLKIDKNIFLKQYGRDSLHNIADYPANFKLRQPFTEAVQ